MLHTPRCQSLSFFFLLILHSPTPPTETRVIIWICASLLLLTALYLLSVNMKVSQHSASWLCFQSPNQCLCIFSPSLSCILATRKWAMDLNRRENSTPGLTRFYMVVLDGSRSADTHGGVWLILASKPRRDLAASFYRQNNQMGDGKTRDVTGSRTELDRRQTDV